MIAHRQLPRVGNGTRGLHFFKPPRQKNKINKELKHICAVRGKNGYTLQQDAPCRSTKDDEILSTCFLSITTHWPTSPCCYRLFLFFSSPCLSPFPHSIQPTNKYIMGDVAIIGRSEYAVDVAIIISRPIEPECGCACRLVYGYNGRA